jgi:hypothetical protein
VPEEAQAPASRLRTASPQKVSNQEEEVANSDLYKKLKHETKEE